MKTYIDKNYQQLKKKLQNYCKHNCLEFDEDIFHDTLISCLEKVTDNSTFDNYLFVAFKTNLFREKDYHRNSMRSEMPEHYDYDINNTESFIDWNNLQETLKKKFGEDLVKMFNMSLEGYSVKEIENMYNQTGLTYKFNKIKKYCYSIL